MSTTVDIFFWGGGRCRRGGKCLISRSPQPEVSLVAGKKLYGRLRSGRGETVNRDNEMMYSILYKFGGQMVQLAPNI